MALRNRFLLVLSIILVGFIAITASFAFIYFRSKPDTITADSYHPYRKDIARTVVASGSLQPIKEVLIKPSISGIVDEILVSPGDEVRVGQLLARLRIIKDLVLTSTAESETRKSELNLKGAERELAKKRALFQKELIPQEELRVAQLDAQLRKEEFEGAVRNLALLREGKSQGSAGHESETQTEVVATTDGVILDVAVKVGQFVTALNNVTDGTTIATIADMSRLVFKGKVPESDVAGLSAGMPFQITIAALRNAHLDGHLTFVSPRGSDEDGSVKFEVRGDFEVPPETSLRAGFSANADIIVEEHPNVLAIKLGDVIIEGGNPTVIVNQPDKKEPMHQVVELGIDDGFDVEVINGLKESDTIISNLQ